MDIRVSQPDSAVRNFFPPSLTRSDQLLSLLGVTDICRTGALYALVLRHTAAGQADP